MEVGGGGGIGFIRSLSIDFIAIFSYVIKETIKGSYIVGQDASIPLFISAFNAFCDEHELLKNRYSLCQRIPVTGI
jgi:hypothetical protein